MLKIFRCLFPVLLLSIGIIGFAQITNNQTKSLDRLKIFIEGDDVDLDNIRNSIKFTDFVNDSKSSDVHIIIIKETTGSGGSNYSIWFNNNSVKDIPGFTLNVNIIPGETLLNTFNLINNTIVRGLMPFFNEVADAKKYKLSIEKIEASEDESSELFDKWNNWMFKLSAWGGYEYEDNIEGYDYTIALKGDKITDRIKLENYIYLRKDIRNIVADGETATRRYIYNYASTKAVLSLSAHWSFGGAAYTYERSYQNTKLFYSGSLVAEYNFFTWDLSDKKILSVAYHVGFDQFYFSETTYRNKMDEFLPLQKLTVSALAIQTWGELEASVTASQYIPETSLYSLSFNSVFSFKITKGLTLDLSFSANSIHDQVYNSANDYSIEDVILENIDIPSTIEISSVIGITYRFGSIYNNIVNNRL